MTMTLHMRRQSSSTTSGSCWAASQQSAKEICTVLKSLREIDSAFCSVVAVNVLLATTTRQCAHDDSKSHRSSSLYWFVTIALKLSAD